MAVRVRGGEGGLSDAAVGVAAVGGEEGGSEEADHSITSVAAATGPVTSNLAMSVSSSETDAAAK